MPTRNDVARRAGVSGATVSYVLNNTRGVRISKKTRDVVRQAAADVGYRTSQAARSLVTGRFQQVGILAPSGDNLYSHYHAGVMKGIWHGASAADYRIVLDASIKGKPISYLRDRFVDGFISLIPKRNVFTPEVLKDLQQAALPAVFIGGGSWMKGYPMVDIDNVTIGREAAVCLLQHGHREIGMLGGVDDDNVVPSRFGTFSQVCAESGVNISPNRRRLTAFHLGASRDAAAELLADRSLTAIFCINDSVALDVMAVAREVGRRIPEDLSIIGVDDLPAGEHTTPGLTTFQQPLVDMGARAFELVIGDTADGPERHVFQPEFINRGSVAPPS